MTVREPESSALLIAFIAGFIIGTAITLSISQLI